MHAGPDLGPVPSQSIRYDTRYSREKSIRYRYRYFKKYSIRYRYDTSLLQYSVVDIIRYSIFLLKRTKILKTLINSAAATHWARPHVPGGICFFSFFS